MYTFLKRLTPLTSLLLLFILGLFLLFSKPVAAGASEGIFLCLQILIPSLFIFLILSDFCVKTGILNFVLKPFGKLCEKLFHTDPNLGPLLFMSLICGYPVGAKLLRDLAQAQKISPQTAGRLLAFSVNAGPAFLIGSVSIPLFGSVSYGFVIFLSQIIAFFIVGILNAPHIKQSFQGGLLFQNDPSVQLVLSVKSAIGAMGNICAYVILFSGIIGLFESLPLFKDFLAYTPSLKCIFYGMLEISNGIFRLHNIPYQFFIAIFLSSFCGICVHLQVFSIIRPAGISMKYFYLYRPIYILSSFLSALLLVKVIPLPAPVQLSLDAISSQPTAGRPIGSIFLIILSIFLLLCSQKPVIIKRKK